MVEKSHQVYVKHKSCHNVVFWIGFSTLQDHLQINNDVDSRNDTNDRTHTNHPPLKTEEKKKEERKEYLSNKSNKSSNREIPIHDWAILDWRGADSSNVKERSYNCKSRNAEENRPRLKSCSKRAD